MPSSTLTRKEARAEARAERLERERAAEARLLRGRRLRQLAGVLAVAAIAVIALVVISQAGKSRQSTGGPLRDTAAVNARFTGIPQRGIALGDPKAPGDPGRVRRPPVPVLPPVRAGRPADAGDATTCAPGSCGWNFATWPFIGPDSQTAAQAAAGAAAPEPAVAVHRPLLRQPGRGEHRLRDPRLPAQVRPAECAASMAPGRCATEPERRPRPSSQPPTLATRNGVHVDAVVPAREDRRGRCSR